MLPRYFASATTRWVLILGVLLGLVAQAMPVPAQGAAALALGADGRGSAYGLAGATAHLFYYVEYPCTAPPVATNYSLDVSDGATTVTSSTFTLTTRSELSASAGGDVLSYTVGSCCTLNQTVDLTVSYDFGNPA